MKILKWHSVMSFIDKIMVRVLRNKIVENVNRAGHHKHCLIMYVVAPFLTQRVSSGHQNQWQALELAKVVGEFGYNVDVINYDNRDVQLTKSYSLIIDAHPGLSEVYNKNVAADCIRIAYITGSNPSFSNNAEKQRLASLTNRRGVLLTQRRYAKPFIKSKLEAYDAMFFIGNLYNFRTYEEFKIKRLFYVRNNGICLPLIPDADGKTQNGFLFLASGGQVHKGLDLLLEVFSRNSNMTLYVCSSFRAEKDFCRLYDRELFHSENIKPVGFIDVHSREFQTIVAKCSFVVLPSCSEANASSILTGMSIGLIPIVSRECGFEDDEVHYFPDCSVESIEATLNKFAKKSPAWLVAETEKIRCIANTRYSAAAFTASIQIALKEVVRGM